MDPSVPMDLAAVNTPTPLPAAMELRLVLFAMFVCYLPFREASLVSLLTHARAFLSALSALSL